MLLRIVTGCVLALTVVLNSAAQQTKGVAPARGDFQISGTLVDAITGQPVARARVAVAPVTQRDNFTTIVTREDGRFLFADLAPGKYTLTAQARGYLLQAFDQHDTYSSSLAVGPELDSSHLLFRIPPEGAISGVVTDEAGEAVRGAQVMLYFTGLSAGVEATRQRGQIVTDDEGAYHFGHLPPGHYLVAVSARPWYAWHGSNAGGAESSQPGNPLLDVAYLVTFYGGVTDAGSATRIALGRGEKVTADVNLQPVPALHIRLDAESADPARRTYPVLQRRVLDAPPIQVQTETRIAPDSRNPAEGQGIQEIVGVPPGHYVVRTYTVVDGASEWGGAREVDVTGNGEIDKSQALAYVPVSATLHFESGAPARQGFLQFLNKKTREGFAERIGADGEAVFKQGLLPGTYEISLSSSVDLYVKSISATGASVTGRTIEIRPGTAVKLSIGAVRGQGAITGTALREGKSFAGAMIVLVPADPAHNQVLFRRDQSDSDGTFTLANVVPGAYTLLALEDGWELEWMKAEVLRNYLGRGTTVQVQPNGKYDIKVAVQ